MQIFIYTITEKLSEQAQHVCEIKHYTHINSSLSVKSHKGEVVIHPCVAVHVIFAHRKGSFWSPPFIFVNYEERTPLPFFFGGQATAGRIIRRFYFTHYPAMLTAGFKSLDRLMMN